MGREELMYQIAELEREIAILPEGSITKKKIKDRDYFYQRINKNGKRTEYYISFEAVPEIRAQIEKRKLLEKKLKDLWGKVQTQTSVVQEDKVEYRYKEQPGFRTIVRYGRFLKDQIALTKKYKKRKCIGELREYIFGVPQDKVFIIYGLRRTGKTTMIRQILTEMEEEDFNKAAYIQVKSRDTLADVNADLRLLEQNGYKYVFIDEVTLMEDFIEGAAIFSDIYASSGMKIVLSGTDSLGFTFSKEEQLYDRCIMLHTTFIPYREFEEVLGIAGIDEYIRYAGTMSLGGVNYNSDITFSNAHAVKDYIDTSIARNIQHSLELYRYGGHFRQLLDLYEKGELTNVINRVVENINHSFTRSVVEKTFRSHDISVTATNMLRDREQPIDIKEHMDVDAITLGIMKMLDILNKEEQSVNIEDCHLIQIKEYLMLLDLIMEIDLEFLPDVNKNRKVTVITQPGMRYAQANAIIENMLLDAKFQELSAKERKRILERLMSEIRGRMMEDIILLETKLANPDKKVFKLQFAVGEFDMVVLEPETLTCQIYEIKYSKEQVSDQCRHINDKEKCAMTSHRYGDITGKFVIYRGETMKVDDVQYLNVEEYLKGF